MKYKFIPKNYYFIRPSLLLFGASLLLGGCSTTPKFHKISIQELETLLAQHEQADAQPTWWYLGTDSEWHYFDTQYPYKPIAPPSFWGTRTNFCVDIDDLSIPNQEPFGQFEVINGQETSRYKRIRKIFTRWTDEVPRRKEYGITYTNE